ncbi:MAG: site-2 protease family protein [Bacilli bacterium]|nr:site-2 protease family protein [Bacilli bacterium]MDY6362838.1 site-2 protease family protein [Bacilli bacterium]
MTAWDWIVSVILFVVSLSALISIHELGHLSMAKLFKVYCFEYSIGFGPALLHKRRKGGETYFSIRAIPFGGYVSMYGEEGTEPEEGLNLSQERSLEGIKKWKKAIVLVAGVVLNAILAFILIAISNLAFPRVVTTRYASVSEGSTAATVLKDNDWMKHYHNSYISYEYTSEDKVIHAGQFYVIDESTEIDGEKYVLAYAPKGTKHYTKFSDGILIYPAIAGENIATDRGDGTYEVINKPLYDAYFNVDQLINKDELYADFTKKTYSAFENKSFVAHLQFERYNSATEKYETINFNPTIKAVQSGDKYVWDDIGLSFKTMNDKNWTFGDRVSQTFKDYGNASVAVFKGIGTLFTGGIKNMSGIVGIFDMTANLYGSYTFATYLYFWGMISVNLAIFNLLPFPGLDGFALLVTVIEGITKKKIPSKVKGIMSAVGLVLLFGLMIAIVVLDIIKLV